jgi:arylsulfatase A-like enzyme
MPDTKGITRRVLLAGAAAAASRLRAAASRPPNVVFIVLDDLGWGDFGCYGQRRIRTPHVDRLAAEGARFTDCYAGGAVCAPSRSVLMTGLHTGHTPVRANAGTIPLLAGDVTVAQVLKKAGYATGGFGKWGLGDARTTGVPTRHGFDRFFGYLHQVHAHSYYPEFLWDNDKQHPLPGNAGGKQGQYSADLIAERSFDFVRENRNRPFFLYGCYPLPHSRFEIPSVAPYEKEPWTDGQKTYAAMVTRADAHIGRVLALLKEYDLERDTVVFVASDNGAHRGEQKGFEFFRSNGPLRGQKGELWEGGIRVPMLVRWPGKVKAGTVNDYPWSFQDFLPTAAEIAGVKAPGGLDGISMASMLAGGSRPEREFLYWEFTTYDQKARRLREDRLAQAVRTGEWKAIRTAPGAPLELYNLGADIGETTNLAARHPQLVARIEKYLQTARTPARPHDTGSMQWVR